MMHKYEPIISTWSEARFQTLTSKAVTKEQLNNKIDLSRKILNESLESMTKDIEEMEVISWSDYVL